MAKRKPPLTEKQEANLSDLWDDCQPIQIDHPFLCTLHDFNGFVEGIRLCPDGQTVDDFGRTIDISDWATVQLHNELGELCGLAHMSHDYPSDPKQRKHTIFTPHGYARGWFSISNDPIGSQDAFPVLWLCEHLIDAWAILRSASTPTRVIVYFQKSNLKYVINAYKGKKALAWPLDHVSSAALKYEDDVDLDMLDVIELPAMPHIALSFDENITDAIDGHNRKHLRLPHTPSGKEQVPPNRFGRWTLSEMLDNIYLIYGTDTCWDDCNKKAFRLSALKHIINDDLYKTWAKHENRKIASELVFDPKCQSPAHAINIFEGLPKMVAPIGSKCDLILKHISLLCRGRDEEAEWLCKWMAYPLQNIGAKMDTSVIMYGSEGYGKSIIFEQVLMPMYGKYCGTIGQPQLDSQYKGWLSGQLFALCEEVVSRSDRGDFKGILKNIITGKTIRINEKHVAERVEKNHINLVFLSNSSIPLELDQGDRRYLVLKNFKVPDQQYFTDLFDEINNGGIEAFREYLLKLPLNGFNAHTKPPLNDDKQELIDISLPNPLLFYKEWEAGELDAPYSSCAKADLFTVYRRWCVARNEFAKRDRDFSVELRRYLLDARKDLSYPDARAPRKTVRVWITPEDQQMMATDPHGLTRLQNNINQFKQRVSPANDVV